MATGVLAGEAGLSLFILYDGFELGAMLDISYVQTIIEPSMLQKKNVHRGEKGTLRWGKLSPTPNQEITGSVPLGSVPPVSLVDIMDPTGCRERDTSPLWSSPKSTGLVKHDKLLDKTLNLGVMRNRKDGGTVTDQQRQRSQTKEMQCEILDVTLG